MCFNDIWAGLIFYLAYCSFVQYTLGMPNTVSGVYHPRDPTASPLWNLLNNHFDAFVERYEQQYERRYGYLRPVIKKVVEEFINPDPFYILSKAIICDF